MTNGKLDDKHMIDLTNRDGLISYLKSHGLWAKKSLGQNFLVDREALDKIVEAADLTTPTPLLEKEGDKEDLVIEIGPGLGVLTEELVNRAGKVTAVELDQKLANLLAENYGSVISTPRGQSGVEKSSDLHKISPPPKGSRDDKNTAEARSRDDKLEVINADILKLNIPELVRAEKYKVVANIPYYITSKILELFLTQGNKPESIVLLVQKEVAERICARPGQLSILALSVQAYGQPEIVGIVPKESFFPAPKVDSAILRIKDIHPFNCHSRLDLESKLVDPSLRWDDKEKARDDSFCGEKDFFRLVHVGFASKRKTLVNNLAAGYHLDKKKASDIIKSIGLDENIRAQELSLDDWQKLVSKLT